MSLENNLLNIRRSDFVYIATENRMKELTGVENERLSIAAADAYYIYYSYTPLLRLQNEDALLEKIRKLFAEIMKTQDYQRIKTITTYNRVLSETYSAILIKKILELLKEEMEKLQQDQQGSPQQNQQGDSQQGNQQNQGQSGQEGGLADKALNRVLDKLIHNGVSQVLQEVNKEFEKARQLYAMFTAAGKEPAPESLIDYANKLYSARAERILKYTEGLMRRLKNIHIARRETPRGIYNGYVKTRRIDRMLPREFAEPELFDIKLVEGGLTYRRTAVKEGDIIVALDDSGSMSGEKEVWARSVAMALYRLAIAARRKYRLIVFDAEVRFDSDNLEDILDMLLRRHYGGGTCIDCALNAALSHKDYSTIVLITDGQDTVNTRPERMRDRKLVAVMISGDNPTLKDLAEKTHGAYMKARLTEDGAIDVISEAGLI